MTNMDTNKAIIKNDSENYINMCSDIEATFNAILYNETSKNILRTFISKTHPSYYLLRFSRLEFFTDILQQLINTKSPLKSIKSFGECDEKFLYNVFGITDRNNYNYYYKNINTICERSFYSDRFQSGDNSRCSEFIIKFNVLVELLQDVLPSNNVSTIGVIKAVYETACGMFAESFYVKWHNSIDCEDDKSLIETITPHIGNIAVDEKYLEVGEITNYFMYKQWLNHNNFFIGYDEVLNAIKNHIEQKSFSSFKTSLLLPPEKNEHIDDITINDVDVMDGVQFEKFIGKVFARQGYLVKFTPVTGDQGVDLIAEKNGVRIGIQAKRYTGRIGNSAIQEIVAGIIHHRCDNAIVVTNSYFTKSAIDLAFSNNVILWDRALLKEKLCEL